MTNILDSIFENVVVGAEIKVSVPNPPACQECGSTQLQITEYVGIYAGKTVLAETGGITVQLVYLNVPFFCEECGNMMQNGAFYDPQELAV